VHRKYEQETHARFGLPTKSVTSYSFKTQQLVGTCWGSNREWMDRTRALTRYHFILWITSNNLVLRMAYSNIHSQHNSISLFCGRGNLDKYFYLNCTTHWCAHMKYELRDTEQPHLDIAHSWNSFSPLLPALLSIFYNTFWKQNTLPLRTHSVYVLGTLCNTIPPQTHSYSPNVFFPMKPIKRPISMSSSFTLNLVPILCSSFASSQVHPYLTTWSFRYHKIPWE
jgi:hypothetical protein